MSLPMNYRAFGFGPGGPGLVASIRYVLRRNGVPVDDLSDLVQEVMLAVEKSATVPLGEPDRTRYIHAIARNMAKARVGELAENLETEPFDDAMQATEDAAAAHGSRELARKLYAAAAETDPQGLDWLVRAKIEGEPETTIAQSDGVPVERVRKRVSTLRRRMRIVALSLGAVASLVLLALFIRRGKLRENADEIGPDYADTPVPPAQPSRKERATALRQRALDECDAHQAADCLRDLDDAKAADPDGEAAPEVARARQIAAEDQRPPAEHVNPPLPAKPSMPRPQKPRSPVTHVDGEKPHVQ